MGHFNVVVIAHSSDEPAVARAASELNSIAAPGPLDQALNDGRTCLIELSDDAMEDTEATEHTLARTSRNCSVTIVWIAAVSSVDAFLYLHWSVGWLQRALICGEQEQFVWDRAEGRVEAWEGTAFDGDEVRGADGVKRVLSQHAANDKLRSPQKGDESPAARAMEWAQAALDHWLSRGEG